jgi:hypothetical protein
MLRSRRSGAGSGLCRTLYWDEDLPGVGMSDAYDAAGQMYRVTYNLPIAFYDTPGHSTDTKVTMDLATGNYVESQDTTDKGGWVVTDSKPKTFFTPQALAGSGVR